MWSPQCLALLVLMCAPGRQCGAPALMGAQTGDVELWCSKLLQGEGIGSGEDAGVRAGVLQGDAARSHAHMHQGGDVSYAVHLCCREVTWGSGALCASGR